MHTSRRNTELPACNGSVAPACNNSAFAGKILRFVYEDSFSRESDKVAGATGEIHVREFGKMNDEANDIALLEALGGFVRQIDSCESEISTVHSFVALFREPTHISEIDFENRLWLQLYSLHLLDVGQEGHAASAIRASPASSQFSVRLAGHQFFVVGLHSGSSHVARKFRFPVLVFNSHKQFESLRSKWRYPTSYPAAFHGEGQS